MNRNPILSKPNVLVAPALALLFACAGGSPGPGESLNESETLGAGHQSLSDDCAVLCRQGCHASSGRCYRDCVLSCEGGGGDPPPPPPHSTVLIAGGEITNFLGSPNTVPTAEVFDSSTNSFTWTGSMTDSRVRFVLTKLDDGRVLAAGGLSEVGRDQIFLNNLNRAESFATGHFGQLQAPMHDGRGNLAGARLSNGQVLLVGGIKNSTTASGTVLNTAEVFQPATNTFALTGQMSTPRRNPTATTVRNGTLVTVLVAGGHNGTVPLSSAELFDPALGRFRSPAGSPAMNHPRWQHTGTLLNNGKVLLTGGLDGSAPQASAELYDPATERFSNTGSMHDARVNHTATLLQNGQVLITGGSRNLNSGADTLTSAELFDPATGTFTRLANSLRTGRQGHTATWLNDGRVLIVGGRAPNGIELSSTELFDGVSFTAGPNLNQGRVGHGAVLLP